MAAGRTWQAGALVGVVAGLATRPAVEALGGRAGQGGHLAGAPAVARRALAAVGAMVVDAEAGVQAQARLAALVHVAAAVLALEARRAGAVVLAVPVGAPGPVGAGAGGAGVNQAAVLACAGRRRWKKTCQNVWKHLTTTLTTAKRIGYPVLYTGVFPLVAVQGQVDFTRPYL